MSEDGDRYLVEADIKRSEARRMVELKFRQERAIISLIGGTVIAGLMLVCLTILAAVIIGA